jgi:hypothetical protein
VYKYESGYDKRELTKDFLVFSFNKMLKITKTFKQLQSIKDKNVIETIMKHAENILTEIRQLKLSEYVFMYQVLLMDVYILARIFREFKGGESPTKVIVYTGNAHTDMYIKLLKSLGFEVGFNAIDKSFNEAGNKTSVAGCVDISGLHRPLFG